MLSKAKFIEVQGHRGARGVRLENTLSAFEAALEAGVDAIELDLVVTSDHEFVIFHDLFINPKICMHADGRTISSPGPFIYSLSLSQLKEFDCKHNPLFPEQLYTAGIKIPTLQELLTMLSHSSHPHAKKVKLNLEIKRNPYFPELTPLPAVLARRIIEVVRKNGFSNRVYYSSFDPEILSELRKIDSTISIAYLKAGSLEQLIEKALELKTNILSPEHTLLQDASFVSSLKQLGFKVIVWTVNDLERVKELVELGVDGIITDFPHSIIKFLNDNSLRIQIPN